jgi:hypothetical protein
MGVGIAAPVLLQQTRGDVQRGTRRRHPFRFIAVQQDASQPTGRRAVHPGDIVPFRLLHKADVPAELCSATRCPSLPS